MTIRYSVIYGLLTAFLLLVPDAIAQNARTFSPEWMAAKASSPLMKAAQTSAVYRPSVRITQFHDETTWINETRTRSEYSGGRLISRVMENSFGETWEPFELREFSYADDGTISSETVYEWGGSAWVPLGRTLYDSQNGVFTQIVNQSPAPGEAWESVERTVFTVQNNLIIGGQTDIWLDDWVPSERFILDEQPNRVHEITQIPDGAGWTNSSRYTYPQVTIEELHEILRQLLTDFEDYEGLYFTLQFPDATEHGWSGTEWVNVSNQTTESFYELYTGRLMKKILTTQEWTGDEWVDSFRTIVDYSVETETAGLPTVATMQVPNGVAWQDLFIETYAHQQGISRVNEAVLSANLGEGLTDVSRTLLQWVDAAGVDVEEPASPVTFVLDQNVPNPFNPSTRISYTLSEAQSVQLSVYDLLGRQIEVLDSGVRPVGEHAVSWDASAMPSGLYLYRLETAGGVAAKTMVLLK